MPTDSVSHPARQIMHPSFPKSFTHTVLFVLILAGELCAAFFCVHLPFALEYCHVISQGNKTSGIGWVASLVIAVVLLLIAIAKFLRNLRTGMIDWDCMMVFSGSALALISLYMFKSY
jgi:cation transport ATPase